MRPTVAFVSPHFDSLYIYIHNMIMYKEIRLILIHYINYIFINKYIHKTYCEHTDTQNHTIYHHIALLYIYIIYTHSHPMDRVYSIASSFGPQVLLGRWFALRPEGPVPTACEQAQKLLAEG